MMGGDLLWHNTVWESAAEDHARTGRGARLRLRPDVRARCGRLVAGADLAICHEEVPFAAPGGAAAELPRVRGTARDRGWIGDDGLGRVHHRVQPRRRPGLRRAGAAPPPLLERAGVRHVGTFRTAAERRRPVILTTDDGVRIGDRRRHLRPQRLPAARGPPVVGLDVGRRQPARPGPRRARGGRRRRRWSHVHWRRRVRPRCPTPSRSRWRGG